MIGQATWPAAAVARLVAFPFALLSFGLGTALLIEVVMRGMKIRGPKLEASNPDGLRNVRS